MRAISIAMVYIASLGAVTYAIEAGYVDYPGLFIISWAVAGLVLVLVAVMKKEN